MHGERVAAEAPKLELPQELLAELKRRGSPRRHDFQVEGWKPSLFERLIERLTGTRRR